MRLKIGVATVTLSGLVLAAAACGGAGGSSGANGVAGSGEPGGVFQAYRSCLAKNGVTLPSTSPAGQPTGQPTDRSAAQASRFPGDGFPGDGFPDDGFPDDGGFGSVAPSGVNQSTWEKAQQACASVRPSVGTAPGTGGPENGGGTGPGGTAPGGTEPGGFGGHDNGAVTAYRKCLADHGVTLPAGGNNQLHGTAGTRTADAIKACEPLRPTGQPSRPPNPAST